VKTIISRSEDQTRQYGKEYAMNLKQGDVVALYGELGSGKTQFIKGICMGLGVKQVVNSPTFIIINEYTSEKIPVLYHFDFYRMKSRDEIMDIGFKDYFDRKALLMIEWPELVENELPDGVKKIFLNFDSSGENVREIKFYNFQS
jgi:tRNA threonylcarbamoyladenosine biosynthesis protein TsaE